MAEVDAGAVAPVVPVAPASTDAPEIESTADQSTETPEGGDKPTPRERVKFDEEQQKEVDRIVAKTRAQESRRLARVATAEAEAAHYKRLLEQQQPQRQPNSGEPQQKDFDDYEKFLIAKAKYEFKQEQAAERETAQRETSTQQEQREFAEKAKHIQTRFKSAQQKYPDFQDVVTGEVPFTQAMTEFFLDSDAAGEIAYHLGTNVEEAERIAGLSPRGQFRELLALESKLTAPPKPTNTPAPIVPNKANASGGKSLADLIGGSQEDFEKRRNERLKAQRARK